MIDSALLLGWGAARRRHLRPYEALYRERGVEVRSEVLEPLAARSGASMAAEVERIARRLDELPGSLVVHMFSRVGFITYGAMLESARGERLRARVAGHVFDSGPGVPLELTSEVYAAQMADGILAARGDDLRGHRPLGVALRTLLRAHYRLVVEVRRHYAEARARYAMRAPVVPALCLYGAADSIVDSRDVEAFAERERRRGAPVERCVFSDSAHVQHLRVHPARYREAVHAFIDAQAR